MTRFAPPTLYQCPVCAGYFKRYTLASLHYHDDVPEWSDGKNGNWWAQASGHVGRCPACSGIVWIDDAKALMEAPTEPRPVGKLARFWHRLRGDKSGRLREERNWLAIPAGIKAAQAITGLATADDYIAALAALLPDALEREVHLRCRLWWVANDHLRACEGSPAPQQQISAEVALANAERLLKLLEHAPYAQVTRGELLRQLGRFDEAVAVLKAVKPDGYSEVKAVKIERLARAGIQGLQALA